ncbi:MAG: hypothetical protein CR993_06580 [Rhodobacterales bacterium]|nr:MAG: hypothetical protein CR993_06580 [Rhodobacterales bacterium]
MIKRFFAASAAAVLFAGAASAADMTSTQNYACNDGSELGVAYINTEAGEAFAVLLIDGKMHVAPVAVSASGARYVSAEGEGYSWHVKNAEGILARVKGGVDQSEGARSCQAVVTPRDCAFTVSEDGAMTYKIADVTEGYELCDMRFPVKAGQEVSAEWTLDSAHMLHILDADMQATFNTFPLIAEADGEMHLRIGLPRAYARRATAPAPFALSVTVK